MSQEAVEYLGICARVEPPLIGIYYRNKNEKDDRKRVYTILLQRLVLNPNLQEVVDQLYAQHPQILKQDKIPKERIAKFVQKIQTDLHMAMDDEDQQYDDEDHEQRHEQDSHDNFEQSDDHAQLNRST